TRPCTPLPPTGCPSGGPPQAPCDWHALCSRTAGSDATVTIKGMPYRPPAFPCWPECKQKIGRGGSRDATPVARMLTRHFAGQRTGARHPSPEGRVVGRRMTGWGGVLRMETRCRNSRDVPSLDGWSTAPTDLASLGHPPPAGGGTEQDGMAVSGYHAARVPNRVRV